LLKTEVVLGAVLLALGLVALTMSQPSSTGFTLILGGIVAVGVAIPTLKTLSRRYQEDELRRMTALDAR
jgi:dipeptide/tripeptide permease